MAEEKGSGFSIGGTLVAVQSMDTGPKILVTAIVILACVVLCWLLWQKPSENQNACDEPAAGSSVQTGSALSLQQSGGVSAGIYNNYQAPPVTKQQKDVALASLNSELDELKAFPSRPDLNMAPTLLQSASTQTAAHRMFVILDRYYKPTIVDVLTVGSKLYEYKKDYVAFEASARVFQEDVVTQIGKSVTVRFRQAWEIYYRYFFFRSAGLSQEIIKEGGSFLNYGLTWEETERVFNEINHDKSVADRMKEQLGAAEKMQSTASSILDEFSTP